MKRLKKDVLNLKNINQDIENRLRGTELDFCKMLIQTSGEDLSFIAKYAPPESSVSLAESSQTDLNDFYYGVSPCLDSKELIRCISEWELRTADMLHAYIKKNGKWFMVHTDQKDYLPSLASYIMVCMASHFGIRIAMDPQAYQAFVGYLKNDCGYSDQAIQTMISYSEHERGNIKPSRPVLTIHGCPTDKVISYLEAFRYEYMQEEDAIPLFNQATKKKAGTIRACIMMERDSASERAITIKEVYSDHVDLIEGNVFYSGVLLKPRRLEVIRDTKENQNIASICIYFERSTYGTVCALDRNLTEHPLLCGEIRSGIIGMLQADDCAKIALKAELEQIQRSDFRDSESTDRMLKAVNSYLENTFNVNQIGVSANIVSCEDLLLLALRGSENIDSGKLYPCVNGNAEVADRNVSFYNQSVFEDYPTIRLDGGRMDFIGEIGREAYGELHMDLPKQEWECCALTISGTMPDEASSRNEYTEVYRRMHFNLIFEHRLTHTMQQIEQESKKAAEAFEIKSFLGLKIICEKNRLIHYLKAIGNGIVRIVNNKDSIEAVIAIILFLQMSSAINRLYFGLMWKDAVVLLLSFLIIGIACKRMISGLIQYYRMRRKTRHICIYENMSYEDINKRISSALRGPYGSGKSYTFHPAAYACLRTYIDRRVREAFYPKNRR